MQSSSGRTSWQDHKQYIFETQHMLQTSPLGLNQCELRWLHTDSQPMVAQTLWKVSHKESVTHTPEDT